MLKLDSIGLSNFKNTRKSIRQRNFSRSGNRLQIRNRFLDVVQKCRGDSGIKELLVSCCRKTRINTLSITEELRKHRTVRSLVLTQQANQQILNVNGVGTALTRREPCYENDDS